MLNETPLADEKFTYANCFMSAVSFMDNIVDQPLDRACRYDRDFLGNKYHETGRKLIPRSRKSIKQMLLERIGIM